MESFRLLASSLSDDTLVMVLVVVCGAANLSLRLGLLRCLFVLLLTTSIIILLMQTHNPSDLSTYYFAHLIKCQLNNAIES